MSLQVKNTRGLSDLVYVDGPLTAIAFQVATKNTGTPFEYVHTLTVVMRVQSESLHADIVCFAAEITPYKHSDSTLLNKNATSVVCCLQARWIKRGSGDFRCHRRLRSPAHSHAGGHLDHGATCPCPQPSSHLHVGGHIVPRKSCMPEVHSQHCRCCWRCCRCFFVGVVLDLVSTVLSLTNFAYYAAPDINRYHVSGSADNQLQ